MLKLRVEFRRVMPLVIHDASVLNHGRTVPFTGLYTQIDVGEIAIGLTVSSYPVAVQAHFIFTDVSSAYFAPLLPTTTASLAINPIRSSTLLAAQAPKNDLVTSTGSSGRAFSAREAVKLHKTTIVPIQLMACLISRPSVELAAAAPRAEFDILL